MKRKVDDAELEKLVMETFMPLLKGELEVYQIFWDREYPLYKGLYFAKGAVFVDVEEEEEKKTE